MTRSFPVLYRVGALGVCEDRPNFLDPFRPRDSLSIDTALRFARVLPTIERGHGRQTSLYQIPVHAAHGVFAVFDPLARVVSDVGSSSRQIVIHDQITNRRMFSLDIACLQI